MGRNVSKGGSKTAGSAAVEQQKKQLAARRIDAAIRACFENLEDRRLFALPVADAGGPYTFNEGSSVLIDGTGSSDEDGAITSYEWDLNYDGSFQTNVTGATFTFSAPDNRPQRTIALRVTQGGQTDIATTTVGVNNVAPTVSVTGDNSVVDGQTYTVNWSATDPGTDTITGWTVNWGDGSTPQNFAANITTADHVFEGGAGINTVTVTATDEDGSHNGTKNVTVTSVSPVVTLTGDPSVDEAGEYEINFSATDAGGDSIDGWIINWGDGESEFYAASINSATHAYADNGDYTITATALGSDGDTGSDTLEVTVDNVDPTGTIAGEPGTPIAEGSAVNLTVTPDDASAEDTFSYAWSVTRNDIAYDLGVTPTTNATLGFTPNDNGTYIATVVITDDDGGHTTISSLDIEVTNEAPAIAIGGAPVGNIDEGDEVNLTTNLTEPGENDTHVYSWSVTRNGDAYELPNDVATDGNTFIFSPDDEGIYEVTVTVQDDDGDSDSDTVTITVDNANPVVAITGAPGAPVNEGSEIALGSTVTDAGNDELTYAWTVTKNGDPYALPGDVVTDEASFAFTPTDEGSYEVTLTVTDGDGGSDSDTTAAITVSNANPAVNVTGPTTGDENEQYTFNANGTDPGSADEDWLQYLWSVEKDGDPYALPSDAVVNQATFSFTSTDEGSYEVFVDVLDPDGGSGSSSAVITIGNVAPTVAINGAPSGTIDEGDAVNLTTTITDADDDTFSYAWSVTKDGDPYDLGVTPTTNSSFSFSPNDEGEYEVTVVVTDNDGDPTTESVTFDVANANPEISIGGAPVGVIGEGTEVNLTSSFNDDGADDTAASYVWSVEKDGDTFDLPSDVVTTASTFDFTPPDDGWYDVTLVVTDNDGGIGSSSAVIMVGNVGPSVSIAGEPMGDIDEGDEVNLTANVTDPGADEGFTYEWSVTKDGDPYALPDDVATDEATFSFTPSDEGNYQVSVTVVDNGFSADTASTATFALVNVAPVVTLPDAPTTGDEGVELDFSADVTDPGSADDIDYEWSVTKDGDPFTLPDGVPTNWPDFSFTPTDEGSYEVTVEVTDSDGGTDSISQVVTIDNVDPTVAITGAPGSAIDENTEISLGATVTDAADDTVASYAWSVTKDGDPHDLGDAAVDEATFAFTPTDEGEYEITLTVVDNDGGSTTESVTVTVANAEPVVTIDGAASVAEGSSYTLDLGVVDAGPGDTIEDLLINWGDGTVDTVAPGTETASHTYVNDGSYTITVTAVDNDGDNGTDTLGVTVTNVAPVVTLDDIAERVRGYRATMNGRFTDVGSADTHQIKWDFGDGVVTTYTSTGGAEALAPSHVYTAAGTYTVTMYVKDDAGAVSSVSKQITVSAVKMLVDPTNSSLNSLFIGGTTGNDVITVEETKSGRMRVVVNGESMGTFDLGKTGRIYAFGQDGNDLIELEKTISNRSHMMGNKGNDTLVGAAGNDALFGGPGADRLKGLGGRDLLNGGTEVDRLEGGAAQDILIGGKLEFSGKFRGVSAVMDEWARSGNRATRINHLDGSLAGGLNGEFLLDDDETVVDDEALDVLVGKANYDHSQFNSDATIKDRLTLSKKLRKRLGR